MSNPSVTVTFPSGKVLEVFPLRVLVQAQTAEFYAKYKMHLPGIAKQHPTVKRIREEYEIDPSVRTWAQLAPVLRQFYADLFRAIEEARS